MHELRVINVDGLHSIPGDIENAWTRLDYLDVDNAFLHRSAIFTSHVDDRAGECDRGEEDQHDKGH